VVPNDRSPELQLLLACGRSAHHRRQKDVTPFVAACRDWNGFLRLMRRHKSLPLVWRCLVDHPDVDAPVRAQLRREHSAALMRSLRMAGILAETAAAFAQAGIRMVALKGPALAAQIYGDATLRQSTDLDLRVRERDVARADSLLRDLGFEPNIPHFDRPLHRRYFMALIHEMQYVDWRRSAVIELHWRPVFNPFLIDFEEDWPGHTEDVSIGRVRVQVPAPIEQMIFLCLHGTKHHWGALRWLFDLVPLLESRVDLLALRAHAERIHAWPYVLQALILLHEYLGITFPPEWATESVDAKLTHRLAWCRRQLAEDFVAVDPHGMDHLGAGWRYSAYNTLLRILQVPADWAQFPLPGPLIPLYVPLRPFFRLLRHRRRRRGDPESRPVGDLFPNHTHPWS
jgi:hypothetical protein